ncbi:MAG: hypothetical protein ABI131_09570 [Nostocoides sp.]
MVEKEPTAARMPESRVDLRVPSDDAEGHEEAMRHFPSNWLGRLDATGDPALAHRDALALG